MRAGTKFWTFIKNPWCIQEKTTRLATWLLALVFISHLAINLLVPEKRLQAGLSTIILLLVKLLGSVALFYAARMTARRKPKYALSWYLWMWGFICGAIADLIWIIFDMVLHISPFPSPADFFYLLLYVLVGLGLVKYPVIETSARERRLAILDNLIVVLGAGLAFWYLFIGSGLFSRADNVIANLLALAYPILDIFMFWFILIFFRNHSQQSSHAPLLLMGAGCIFGIAADILFAYKTTLNSGAYERWMDLGWTASYLVMSLGGIQQVKNLLLMQENTRPIQLHPRLRFLYIWPVYLPYFWLTAAYAILAASLSSGIAHLLLYLMVGLIMILVIFRQVLTLTENEELYQQAQLELAVRKQAQASLRKTNLELDERVRQRTDELLTANDLLVQTNQKLERSLHEKEVLLKEIHHRVKNNLQTVSSLLNLQARLIQDPASRAAFQESRMRVQSMALIHEKLYQSGSLAEINLHLYVESLASILFQSYQAQSGPVRLVTRVDDIPVGIDTAIPMGLILNELISNALKHAFPDGRSGEIIITLQRESGAGILLCCQDDGCGLPENMDVRTSKSLGLQLVNSLVSQLSGTLAMHNASGTQFVINIPAGDVDFNFRGERYGSSNYAG